MRKNYPSDISREQFEIIKPLLECARWKTYPRRIDLSEVFCAVLCIYSGAAANGACCPRSFPNSAQHTRTFPSGVNYAKVAGRKGALLVAASLQTWAAARTKFAVRQRLSGQTFCPRSVRNPGKVCDGTNRQS